MPHLAWSWSGCWCCFAAGDKEKGDSGLLWIHFCRWSAGMMRSLAMLLQCVHPQHHHSSGQLCCWLSTSAFSSLSRESFRFTTCVTHSSCRACMSMCTPILFTWAHTCISAVYQTVCGQTWLLYILLIWAWLTWLCQTCQVCTSRYWT